MGRLLLCGAVASICTVTSVSAVNIAPTGDAILGVNAEQDSTYGLDTANSGTLSLINDETLGNGVDTFNSTTAEFRDATVNFVGIIWDAPVAMQITSLTLHLETFKDGGWFGERFSTPGGGGTLTAADHLIAPSIQVSYSLDPTSDTAVWTTISATTDYLSQLDGHVLPTTNSPTFAPPATFTLDVPVTGIYGIRIIGSEGGNAGSPNQGGFIGIRELEIEAVPEPTSIAALFCGLAVLCLRRRSR